MDLVLSQMGERIRNLKIRKGYSQEQLAEYAKISTKFLYSIEKGKCGCSSTTLLNLANALEIDCDYLLTGKVRNIFKDDEIYSVINTLDNQKRFLIKQILRVFFEYGDCLAKDLQ